MEEEPNDEDLQTRHGNHHKALDDAEVENATLRAPDRAEVSVFSGAEVLLVAVDGGELRGQLEYGLFEDRGLLRRGALLGGEFGALFVLNLF